ncbi:MAG: hypothetical protein ACXW3C_18240 [Pyrinomonadaceae bacterium]
MSVLCCVANASAQCGLKIDQIANVPELRGFRLGMTFDQVKVRVPQIQFGRADDIGVTSTSINPSYDPLFDQASFADVRTISLDFLDGSLTSLWIGYEKSFKWKDVDQFVDGISKSLNLPSRWSPKKAGQQLRCDGFTIFVSMIAGGPSLRLTEDAAEETIGLRREAAVAADESMVIGDKVTKLYYPAGCDSLESVAALNRISFKNRDEAEAAGYKLAKGCE